MSGLNALWALPAAGVAAGVALVLALLVVLTADRHGRLTMDSPGSIQKFHTQPTPRVGGVAVYLALVAAWTLLPPGAAHAILMTILIAGIPPLAFGLLEDLTKRISVSTRLLATMTGAVVAWAMTGLALTRLDIGPLDEALRWTPLAVLFTAFATGGVANAVNIIDGFHGLAAGAVMIALGAMAVIAGASGDFQLASVAVIVAAALAGFLLVNFPWGKLFLGDGGAYFAGFALAWIAVLLPARNPSVSPWASLLICVYPVTEVIYSILRRFRGRQSPGEADRRHLHSLLALHVVQPRLRGLDESLRNASVSVLLWGTAALPAAVAVAWHDQTPSLMLSAAAFGLLYHLLYRWVDRT